MSAPFQTERELYRAERQAAKEAMKCTAAEMKENAREMADVRAWTRQFPLSATGAAFAGGVAATARPRRLERSDSRTARTLASARRLVRSVTVSSLIRAIQGL
ncbi:MAG: hypothetical protein RL885_10730 [Planctomycetota bacterium]